MALVSEVTSRLEHKFPANLVEAGKPSCGLRPGEVAIPPVCHPPSPPRRWTLFRLSISPPHRADTRGAKSS